MMSVKREEEYMSRTTSENKVAKALKKELPSYLFKDKEVYCAVKVDNFSILCSLAKAINFPAIDASIFRCDDGKWGFIYVIPTTSMYDLLANNIEKIHKSNQMLNSIAMHLSEYSDEVFIHDEYDKIFEFIGDGRIIKSSNGIDIISQIG